ncbi:DUF4214 domain-containing protein [Marimonas sp. MJW-29]|uniref:DUF4214 domain-containing protein n=1 Tax=Sulfitobacter sediminis TaxID=3234186 RepID=A0ABV3RQZ7_9RHOB
MATYTLPAYVITADGNSVPTNAFTSEMEIIAPNSAPSFSYDIIRVEDFDGLGNANVVSLNQTVISKTVEGGSITVPETNYHAIFEVLWGGGNRSIVMVASATATTRVGIVLDGDPFPAINSLQDYYDWVDDFTSLTPVTSGPYAAGQQIGFADFPGVAVTASANTIGTPGDDFLEGDTGNDAFNGLGGVDTAFFGGAQSNYTLEISGSGFTIEDHRPGGQGRDTLTNVEFLDFGTEIPLLNGEPLQLATYDGALDLTTADFLQIIELYIAYFNRAPDAVGLLFWANAYADGISLDRMAELFTPQPETQAAYPPGTTNEAFVTTIYDNVFGRAPDQAGFDFWVGQLNGGAARDVFILEVLRGARVDIDPSFGQALIDQQLADRAYLGNKTDIGTYFAITRGMSDVDNASTVMELFDGSAGSVTAAVNATDQFYGAAQTVADSEFLMQLIGVLDSPF